MATAYLEISEAPGLQTKFTIELRPELAETLGDWFHRCDIKSLDELVEQIIESSVAEYRLEMLPPREEDNKSIRHGGISRATRAEIVDAFLCEEETTVVELAVRFSVGRTTIRRALEEFSEETGFVLKRKPKLTDEQIGEIAHAIYVEGKPAEEVAAKFGRGTDYIKSIARKQKQAAAV